MRQLDEAADWWQANRPDAPNALADELQDTLARIVLNPEVGTVVRSRRYQSVRRRLMRRTHYHVFYRIAGDGIEIVAVWHASRGSGPPI